MCEGSVAEVATLVDRYAAGTPRLTAGPTALLLDAGAPTAEGVTAVAVPRVRGARVRYARWLPPTRVTVEVEPWSHERSELLIRPARRLPPGADAYLGAAAGLLEALVRDLGLECPSSTGGVAAPVDPLRRAS